MIFVYSGKEDSDLILRSMHKITLKIWHAVITENNNLFTTYTISLNDSKAILKQLCLMFNVSICNITLIILLILIIVIEYYVV